MRISTKLMINTVLITFITVLLTATLLGRLAYINSKQSLEEQARDRLIAVRDIKADQVHRYFNRVQNQVVSFSNNMSTVAALKDFKDGFDKYSKELKNYRDPKYRTSVIEHYTDVYAKEYAKRNGGVVRNARHLINILNETSFALQYHYILENPYKIKEKSKLLYVDDKTSYSNAHKKYHLHLYEFMEKFGYQDIMMADAKTGNIIYSVDKKLDFTTSLINGPYADTHVGSVFRKALQAKNRHEVAISDFRPYLPTYDDQAAFVASAIWDGAEKVGVMIFQLPIAAINTIMTSEKKWADIGLGQTGETYLIGADKKMRSMSRFLIENPEAYFSEMQQVGTPLESILAMRSKSTSVGLQLINTEASKNLNSDKVGYGIYQDYRGVEVLGAYEPLQIPGLSWGIIAEIDKREAFRSVVALKRAITAYTVIVMGIVAMLGIMVGNSLAKQISIPINKFSEIIMDIAKSQDLTKRIKINTKDELSEMADSLNSLIESFQETCQETIISSHQVQKQADRLMSMAAEMERGNGRRPGKDIQAAGDSISELSSRLQRLSRQFKVFEEEAERKSTW